MQMNRRLLPLKKHFFGILLTLASVLGWGQILTFDFVGLAGGETTASSNFNNTNLASSTISRGAGLIASANADRFNSNDWAENPYDFAISGVGTNSAETDIVAVAGSEASVIYSLENDNVISTTADGVQVWQIKVRDGGSDLMDADLLPSILTSFSFAQNAGNSVGTWSDAIQSIALFDGNTKIANGTVTANQIQFTEFSFSVPDNSEKTLSIRLSLKNPLGADAFDNEDFVFSLTSANTTFDAAGSGKTNFAAVVSTNGLNVIDVIATELRFVVQPSNVGVNATMNPHPRVAATDINGNIDKDFNGNVNITSSGTLLATPLTVSATAGTAVFNNVKHTVAGTGFMLTATSGSFTGNSNPFNVNLQTEFKLGELVFVGYDGQITGSGAADEFLIATFTDIIPNTTFSLVNSRYEAGALANVRTNKWGGGGDVAEEEPYVFEITYNGTSNIPAGSVIAIRSDLLGVTSIKTIESNAISTERLTEFTVNLKGASAPNISTSGSDQLYLVQGNFTSDGNIDLGEANYILNGRLLHGITNRAPWVPLTSACNGGTVTGNARESRLPSELECFNVENSNTSAVTGHYHNSAIHEGSLRQLILGIGNSSNWKLTNGTRYSLSPTTNTTSAAGRTFTFLPGNTPGTWVSSADNNWFNCANWETLFVPDETTNVLISNAYSTINPKIDYTSTSSDKYGDVAKVKNITIEGLTINLEGSSNNKLEVYGDLVVNSPGGIDMDDNNPATQDGQIYLYGNWTNNAGEANFLQGQSTVHLLGNTKQVINNNDHTNVEKFGNLVLGNNFNTKESNDLHMDGTLMINANKVLNIDDKDNFVEVVGNVTNNGLLTVGNDANFIQRDGTYTGNNITVKRIASLKRSDYNYWGSPVMNQNLKAFSSATPNARFYVYNESNDYFDGIFVKNRYPNGTLSLTPIKDPATYSFSVGKGYAVRTSNTWPTQLTDFEGVYVGQPHNGSISLPLDFTDSTRGNNLISNPYPSNIDFDAFYAANSTLIDYIAYFWTNVNPNPQMQGNQYPKTGSINNYAVYTGTGGLSAPYGFVGTGNNTTVGNIGNCPTCKVPNNIIKVGQGFIVKAKSSGNLTFNNTIRSKDGKGKFFNKTAAIQKDRFWLELKTPLNFVNPLLIGYITGATDAFELGYDAPLFIEGADSFYSILGQDKLAIQGKQHPMNLNDVVPLGATFYETGAHTISLANKDGIFGTGQPIYLHDKAMDSYTDLQKQDYTFIADKGEVKDRFEITYSLAKTLSLDVNNKYGLKIYRSGDYHIIEADKVFASVKILDMSGRLIAEVKSGNKYLTIENSKLATGVNIFSIIFADDIVNKKIISK